MKNKFLSIALAVATCFTMALSVGATENEVISSGDGLNVSKSVSDNNDGSYKINLESYVTGNVTTSVTHYPTDVILVLDESSSMNENFDYQYVAIDKTATNDGWYNGSEIYYAIDGTDDYYSVNVSYQWGLFSNKYTYSVTIGSKTYSVTSTGSDTTFDLCSQLNSKVSKTGTLYYYSQETRLDALKRTAKMFIGYVEDDAEKNNLDNRIAVVTFSSQAKSAILNGTKVLLANDFSDADETFNTCLKTVTSEDEYNDLIDSIDSLTTDIGTRSDTGFELADKILEKRSEDGRNKTVVFITDGVPTNGDKSGPNFNSSIANSALQYSEHIKNYTNSNAECINSVYSIGLYEDADPSQFYDNDKCYTEAEKANRFMNLISSNYPHSTTMDNDGNTDFASGYFLKAEDADELAGIFKSISEQIATPSISLDETAVVSDVVSQYFELPDGFTKSDVTVETENCTGKSNGVYTFDNNPVSLSSADVTIDGDKVAVSGFDYSKYFCSDNSYTVDNQTTYGKKLIVSFNIVPKSEFAGGNDVPTNDYILDNGEVKEENLSGVYVNSTSTSPVKTFDIPTANVVVNASLEAEKMNVYAGNQMPDTNDIVTAGMDGWQYDYLDISSKADSSFSTLADGNCEYTITLTPISSGANSVGAVQSAKNISREIAVSVFKPIITCYDSTMYLGEKAADYVPTNVDLTNVEYQNDSDTKSTDVTMCGTIPTLSLSFDLEPAMFEEDTPVAVTKVNNDATDVDLLSVTKFLNSASQEEGKQFTVFVKTCSLNIEKTFSGDTTSDDGESFIFDIKGSGNDLANNIDMQVLVTKDNLSKTIVGLPIGTYTITEDGDWSWKYTTSDIGNVSLSPEEPNGSTVISNEFTNHNWLDDYSFSENVFDKVGVTE